MPLKQTLCPEGAALKAQTCSTPDINTTLFHPGYEQTVRAGESDSLLIDGLYHHGGGLPQVEQSHDSSHSQAQVLAQVLVLAQTSTLGCFLHNTMKMRVSEWERSSDGMQGSIKVR